MTRLIFAATLVLFSAGCGSTIGDACTTQEDCGDQLCLNKDYTPGGYCTKQCTVGDADSCPGGSQCVEDAAAKDLPACLRICNTVGDCRNGYQCRVVHDSPRAFCVGPEGI